MTFCDFNVRKLNQTHTYTAQCVIMLNYLNEKIFIALWWWLLVLIAASVWSIGYWYSSARLR